jgi:uncharacterized protein YjdB
MSAARSMLKSMAMVTVALIGGCDGPTTSPEAPVPPAPARITIRPAGPTTLTSLGDTLRLTATVRDSTGTVIPDAPVTWTSGSPSVASIEVIRNGAAMQPPDTGPDARVEAVANGSSTLTAASGGVTGTLLVHVAQTAASVTITPASLDTLFFRDTMRLTAAATDARGNPIANPQFRWSTSDPLEFVTSVDTGGFTPSGVTAIGSSVLFYPTAEGTGSVVTTAGPIMEAVDITVRQKVVRISLDLFPVPPAPLVIGGNAEGEFGEVFARAADSHGSDVYYDKRQLTIASSDSSVVLPRVTGDECRGSDECTPGELFLHGERPGSATITVSLTTVDGTFTATAAVTVIQAQ